MISNLSHSTCLLIYFFLLHKKCKHTGCSYTAAPKLVAAHSLIHSRSLPSLDTPEEIARYRQERRKNYPTDANVKRKMEEEAEKRARGEIPEVVGKGRGKRGRGGHSRMQSRHNTTNQPSSSVSSSSSIAAQPIEAPPPPPPPRPPSLAGLAAYGDSEDEAPAESSAKIEPSLAPTSQKEEVEIKSPAPKKVLTWISSLLLLFCLE